MTEYKTFDDYVKNTFNIEPRELTHISPEEQKKKTVAITVDELINIWNELTELKAGRPQWHKVADGDLPKENKRYLCKIKEFVGSGISYECFDYDTEYSSWKNACGDVIEWCEIPKYTEE